MCYIHCGFITGWFERCFDMNVVCVEKECKAAGAKKCVFVIGLPSKIYKHVSTDIINAFDFILIEGQNSVNLMDEYRDMRRGLSLTKESGSPIVHKRKKSEISTDSSPKVKITSTQDLDFS